MTGAVGAAPLPVMNTTTGLSGLPRSVALTMLRGLYARLPAINCKGLCHDSCTHVDVSQLEWDVLAERGITLPNTSTKKVMADYRATGRMDTCPALSPGGRCTVYDDRPYVCRAFGAVSHPDATPADMYQQAMMCDHRCEPDFTLDVETFTAILCEIEALSRAVTGIARGPIPGDSPALKARFRRDDVTGHRVGRNINELLHEPAWRRADRARKRKQKRKRKGSARGGGG